MRVVWIAAIVAMAASPALASPSCMTQSEARQKFPTQHLWWHGPNRCWDATPSRTQLSKRINTRSIAREAQPDRETDRGAAETLAPEKPAAPVKIATPVQPKKPQGWAHDSRWRESMSRMLPGDEPPVETQGQVRLASTPDNAGSAPAPSVPQIDWRDRWIEIATAKRNVAAPADIAASAEPVVTPARVMLALLAVVLTLGFVELVFRKTQPDWRR